MTKVYFDGSVNWTSKGAKKSNSFKTPKLAKQIQMPFYSWFVSEVSNPLSPDLCIVQVSWGECDDDSKSESHEITFENLENAALCNYAVLKNSLEQCKPDFVIMDSSVGCLTILLEDKIWVRFSIK